MVDMALVTSFISFAWVKILSHVTRSKEDNTSES